MAARALFAFEVGEREGEVIEPSADALLGALLKAEERAVNLKHAENFAEFAQFYAKVVKARSKRPARRR